MIRCPICGAPDYACGVPTTTVGVFWPTDPRRAMPATGNYTIPGRPGIWRLSAEDAERLGAQPAGSAQPVAAQAEPPKARQATNKARKARNKRVAAAPPTDEHDDDS